MHVAELNIGRLNYPIDDPRMADFVDNLARVNAMADRMPGFVEFHLLKGSEAEDHTLYSSHTVWQSKAAFEAWTKSDEFRAAHARAGNESTGSLYLEHPKFEGFEVRQTLASKVAAA